MSRSRKSSGQRDPPPFPSGLSPSTTISVKEPPPNDFQRRMLGVTLVLVVGWSVALLLMGVFTANPELLSADQVRQSELVVVGRLTAKGADQIVVERVLHGNVKPNARLTVLNLRDVAAIETERAYIFPLSPFRDDYVVTTLDEKHAPSHLLIYPATPTMIVLAKRALE